MADYVGNADYRGWLAADPNKQWALDFVGNDYSSENAGINMDAIQSLSEGPGAVVGPGVPNGAIPASDVAQMLRGYAGQYAELLGSGVLGASTSTPGLAGDPTAAANAAKAAQLRGNITNLVNSAKDIFNSRYGLVDQAAADQSGKLGERYASESGDITKQAVDQSNQAGGAFAARGTRDSSDYGNTVDTIKAGADKQIKDLGTELEDNRSKIGAWAASEKSKFDAEKGGMDAIVSHLAESTDPEELTTIRNQIDAKLAELKAGAADYNTNAQNKSTLDAIAPSGQRAQQLVTTLSSIVKSSADPGLKRTIAERLVNSANLSADDAQRLLNGFNAEISTQEKQQQA